MNWEPKTRPRKAIVMVRAGEEAHLYDACRQNGYVTMGWFCDPPEDLTGWPPAKLEARFRATYPVGSAKLGKPDKFWDAKAQTTDIGQVGDFLYNMPVGRRVMIASPDGGHSLMLGEVVGDYEFHPEWNPSPRTWPYCHFKRVEWLGECRRSDLLEAAGLGWSNQHTVWWIEDLAAIRDIESAALLRRSDNLDVEGTTA